MPLLSMATSGGACTVKLIFPSHPNAVGLRQTRHAGLQLIAAWPDSLTHVPLEFHQPCAMQGRVLQRVLPIRTKDFLVVSPNMGGLGLLSLWSLLLPFTRQHI